VDLVTRERDPQCPICGETKLAGWTYCPACGHPYEDDEDD
jgi:ribosomal protein L32